LTAIISIDKIAEQFGEDGPGVPGRLPRTFGGNERLNATKWRFAMGLFDWVFKQRYDSEKEWLRQLLNHTNVWLNELTKPLRGFLAEIELGTGPMDPELYSKIAGDLYNEKISINSGSYLRDTIKQMSDNGIPLFTSRDELRRLTDIFLEAGAFLKWTSAILVGWSSLSPDEQESYRNEIYERWINFQRSGLNLKEHIIQQLKSLG
jgi:hypothetical protein